MRGAGPSGLVTGAPAAAGWYLLLPMAVGGLVVLRRARVTLVPFLGPALMITWAAAITFGITRYRVALEVGLVVLAAVAIEAVVGRHRQRRSAE